MLCTTSGKFLKRNGSLGIISTWWSFHSGQEHIITESANSTIVFLTSNTDRPIVRSQREVTHVLVEFQPRNSERPEVPRDGKAFCPLRTERTHPHWSPERGQGGLYKPTANSAEGVPVSKRHTSGSLMPQLTWVCPCAVSTLTVSCVHSPLGGESGVLFPFSLQKLHYYVPN